MVYIPVVTRLIAPSLILLAAILGCTAQPVVQPVAQPATAPEPEASLPKPNVGLVLNAAELNYTSNQLTTPPGNNALEKYHAVLMYDPKNIQAREGINKIVEKYLTWARDQADQGNLVKALEYLTLAESVDASHPNIGPLAELINDRERPQTITYKLPREDVIYRRADRIRFDTMAWQIEQSRAFVTIRAPNDATGRWLYQELNALVSFRVEAAFEYNSRPSITLSR